MSGITAGSAVARVTLPIFSVLLIAACCLAQDNTPDDGWRRTKEGWERVASWNVTRWPGSVDQSRAWQQAIRASSWDRYLVHPAGLALGLLLLGCAVVSISSAAPQLPADVNSP